MGTSGTKNAIDKHHIFPKNYLTGIGFDSDRDRNQIANFTYLDYATNIEIYNYVTALKQLDISYDQKLIFNRMKSGLESEKYIASLKSELDGAIIIVNDISCGVVPIDADVREWRECVGRVCAMLARSAERVIRIFCGLPQVIK